eukprot:Em0008g703a
MEKKTYAVCIAILIAAIAVSCHAAASSINSTVTSMTPSSAVVPSPSTSSSTSSKLISTDIPKPTGTSTPSANTTSSTASKGSNCCSHGFSVGSSDRGNIDGPRGFSGQCTEVLIVICVHVLYQCRPVRVIL